MSAYNQDYMFGGSLFSEAVHLLCHWAIKPGRPGVEAAMAILNGVPHPHHAEAMKLVWRDPAGNRVAWACLMTVAWRCSSRPVRKAAGTRERLIRWFEAADYGQPMLREACGSRDELPPRQVLYPGGAGPLD